MDLSVKTVNCQSSWKNVSVKTRVNFFSETNGRIFSIQKVHDLIKVYAFSFLSFNIDVRGEEARDVLIVS